MSTMTRMRWPSWTAALAVAGLVLGGAVPVRSQNPRPTEPPRPAAVEDGVAVYYSPRGGAAEAVMFLVRTARQSIHMEAFMFTHDGITEALIEAHRRGVEVDVIMDRGNADIDGSARRALRRSGITVYLPPEDLTMHNKVIIIDERTIVTGSFNFTHWADQKNAENLLVLHDKPKLARAYLKMHEHLQRGSKKYASE